MADVRAHMARRVARLVLRHAPASVSRLPSEQQIAIATRGIEAIWAELAGASEPESGAGDAVEGESKPKRKGGSKSPSK